MRLGYVGKFSDPGLAERLGILRKMGIEALDIQAEQVDAEVKRFVAQAREQGVPVQSLAPPWGWIDRALKDPQQVEGMIAFIRELPALDVRSMNISCSMVKSETEAEQEAHFQRVADVFRRICQVAEAEDVRICSHITLFRRGILFGTVEGVDRFLATVTSPANRLLFCCGCVSAAGEDVAAMIRHWRQYIGAVHVFNLHGNRDGFQFTRFDQGQMDVIAVLRALKEIGYQGMVLPHEYPAFSGPAGQQIADGWAVGYFTALRQVLAV